jgi:LuxR family transcriptional regulator, maltose regulon positive regulatory protein
LRADRLTAGAEALLRGAWAEARASFEAVLEDGESPEALEGLGTAAEWLVDAPTLFASRERAYRLYREGGSARDAARVAIQLGWDYRIFRGEPAVATGWLERARDLLQGVDPAPEHGWLALREASVLLGGGQLAAARELTAKATELGRSLEDVDLEMTALALEGLVLVNEGRVAEGMRRLDGTAAAVVGGDMRDLSAISYACCYLIFACERVRDFARAGQWCERLAAFCEQYGSQPLFSICRTHYAGVLVSRGRWSDAEQELRLAAPDLEQHAAGMAAETFVGLAELRRRQGRLEEARRMFEQVEHRPDGRLGCSRVALDLGDHRGAVDHAERYLREIGEETRMLRVGGLEILGRALAGLGQHNEALAAVEELDAVAREVGTDPLKACALAARGIVDAASGNVERARTSLEDAVALYQRNGMPYECACSRLELAMVLAEAGRAEAAERERRVARGALEALGVEGRADRGKENALDLTRRELEVLELVADGLTDTQIAARLVISEHTVHRHVANIMAKLSCSSRAAAVKRAAAAGAL